MSRTTYSDLFTAVSINWGVGDGVNTFNVPDLRGRFLRGQDEGTGNDPDSGSRTAILGGNTGDNVGSYQNDDLNTHDHYTMDLSTVFGSGSGVHFVTGSNNNDDDDYIMNRTSNLPDDGLTSPAGGSETRPENAYVKYLIKI